MLMLDDRSFQADVFGLHACYRTPIDSGDLEASLQRLASALDLRAAALATQLPHCRGFEFHRAAFALLHQLFIRHDPRLTSTLRHYWTATLDAQTPWTRPPSAIEPSCDFEEWLYPSFGMTLPIDDGRWLHIAPGELPVTVRMSMAPASMSSSTTCTGLPRHARRLRCSPA
jgi:hypothetical protein